MLSSLGVASGRRIGVERSGADADVERSRDGGDVTGIQPQRTAVGHWLLQRLDEYLGFAGACCFHISTTNYLFYFIMRPSSLGGGRILRRTLSVRLSVCPSVPLLFIFFTVEPSYERTSKIEKLRFSLMGQRDVCTFRHALRAAYRTAISAAQILVYYENRTQSTDKNKNKRKKN